MRLFAALDIDDSIRERIARFMEGVRGFAPDARWVRPESIHVTLKFIGEKPDDQAEKIKQALSRVKGLPFTLSVRGYGFFPTPKSARVFWIGVDAEAALATLATSVDDATFTAGVPKEEHPFSPHLTLARGGGRSGAPQLQRGDGPNRNFQHLQEKLAAMSPPEFGTMTAHEFFLFKSELMRGGSRYTRIAAFPLD